MDLDHRHQNYAGEWRQEACGHWRCSGCDVVCYRAQDVDIAARRENEIGHLVKVLAAIGQQQMDAEGPSW